MRLLAVISVDGEASKVKDFTGFLQLSQGAKTPGRKRG
jgi:hypothetical protein